MKTFFKRVSLGLMLLVLSLNLVAFMPAKKAQAIGSGDLNFPSGFEKTLHDSINAKFLDPYHIKVTGAPDTALFKSTNYPSTATFGGVINGVYTLSDNCMWTLNQELTFKSGSANKTIKINSIIKKEHFKGGSTLKDVRNTTWTALKYTSYVVAPVFAIGKFAVEKALDNGSNGENKCNLPKASASEKDILDWLKTDDTVDCAGICTGTNYRGLHLTIRVEEGDSVEYMFDQLDDGKGMGWKGLDGGTIFSNLFKGVSISTQLREQSAHDGLRTNYAFVDEAAKKIIEVTDTSNSYLLCTGKHYFQQNDCTSGWIIKSSAWDSLDDTGIINTLKGTGTYKATLVANISGKDREVDIYIAQLGSELSQAINDGTIQNSDEATEGKSCESEGGDFSFIICPVLRLADEAIGTLDGWIQSNLEVNMAYFDDPQDSSTATGGVRRAWANMRNIAYLVLIPMMLVMVIGTALGFKFLDAYTVKRAMPRLLVAVIFMALSFDIVRIMVEATNVIGRGMGGLVAAPFGGLSNLGLSNIFNPGVGGDVLLTGGAVVGGIALFAVGAVSLGIIASYLFVAAVAMLIIFVLLGARVMILLFLAILAPLAILAWIFPGNDKMWKLWWGTFSKLLLLYPVMMVLLFTGRGFAKLVADTGTDMNVILSILIRLTAYIGPFFFTLSAFKWVGGAFGNLVGMVNDRGKGIFDRSKKWRGEERKHNKERIAGSKAFRGGNKNNLRGRLNTALAKGYAQKDVLKEGGISRFVTDNKAGTAAIMAKNEKAHRDHILKDPELAAWIGYDDLTGLSSLVSTGDWTGAKSSLTNKYGYTGDVDGGLAEAKKLADSGDVRGAMKKVFEMADHKDNKTRAFNGDRNFLDTSLAQVTNAYRKYGDQALNQALVLKTMAGGTFYQSAGDNWDAMLASATHDGHIDRNAVADMTIQGRQMLMQTGRLDSGGASFGATMGANQMLEQGAADLARQGWAEVKDVMGEDIIVHSREELRAQVTTYLGNKVIEQNGSAAITHPSMKTGVVMENLAPVLRERIKIAYAKGEDSAEYKGEIAAAESLWKSLSNTKPEAAKIIANEVMSYSPSAGDFVPVDIQNSPGAQLEVQNYISQMREWKALQVAEARGTDKDGNPLPVGFVLPPRPNKPNTVTVRMETSLLQNDPVYQNFAYQWQSAEQQIQAQAQAQAQLLAQQQAAAAGGAGIIPPPVPPMPGNPFGQP